MVGCESLVSAFNQYSQHKLTVMECLFICALGSGFWFRDGCPGVRVTDL